MPSHPSRWTLRATLLASMLALFSVVMRATGALTVLETRRYLELGLMSDLDAAVGRVDDGRVVAPGDVDGDGRVGPGRGRGGPGAPGGGSDVLVLGLTPSGAVATSAAGVPVNSVVTRQRDTDTLEGV